MSRDTCLATRRGEQSAAMLDLRMSCLDRWLDELALVGALPATVTGRRVRAGFTCRLEPCADRDALAGVPLPPPAACGGRRASTTAGPAPVVTPRYREALAESTAWWLRPARWAIRRCSAKLLAAGTQNHAGQVAASLLQEAIAPLAGRDDETLAEAWTVRTFVSGIRQSATPRPWPTPRRRRSPRPAP
jgi:hypothetical protein